MKRNACVLLILAGWLSGCVERRFVIETDPPGATVYVNDRPIPIGNSPADDHFVYYGKYDFTLVKDGFATTKVQEKVSAPWYQYFPLDFMSETLVPFRIRDVRRYHYQMQPLPIVNAEQLLNRGQELRNRGNAIAPPAQPAEPRPNLQPAEENSTP